jgi:hypothetical protein
MYGATRPDCAELYDTYKTKVQWIYLEKCISKPSCGLQAQHNPARPRQPRPPAQPQKPEKVG